MLRQLIVVLFAFSLAACGSNIDPTPIPISTEAAPNTRILARVPQADAPALWIGSTIGIAAWIGSDEAGVHIDARSFSPDSGEMSPIVVLPLPPNRPTALSLYPAPRRSETTRVRALWLDADDTDTTQLYSAVIANGETEAGDLRVERGPIRISDRPVLRYAAAVDASGSLWAVWSGIPSMSTFEASLFLQSIDGDGRAQPPISLASDAEWFALTPDTDGSLLLFWIEGTRVRLMRIIDGTPLDSADVTNTIALSPVDRLTDFRVGIDQTHRYLFWNVERFIDGAVVSETWWTTGGQDGFWSTPARLTVTLDGNILSARRAAPAYSNVIAGMLPVIFETDRGLVIQNFSAGSLPDAHLLDLNPTLIGALNAVRMNETQFVAWADAESPDAAVLTLIRLQSEAVTLAAPPA